MGNIRKKSENLIALLVVFALGSIMMTSCQKDKDPEIDYSKVYLLKREIHDGYNFHMHVTLYYDYVYDTAGRIVKTSCKYPTGAYDSATYVYNTGSIIIYKNGFYTLTDTIYLKLNEKGLVVTENQMKSNILIRYQYNEDGYRILSKSYSYGTDTTDITGGPGTTTYTYDNGNLIRVQQESGYKADYSYYNNKVNTLGYRNKGMAFYGKSSKNLAIDKDATDQFDAENRLIKRFVNDWTYEYQYSD